MRLVTTASVLYALSLYGVLDGVVVAALFGLALHALLGGRQVLAGVLIGCIGIGGVLLVPALTYLGGIDIHVAITSCMVSYMFAGLVGAVSYARKGSIRWL